MIPMEFLNSLLLLSVIFIIPFLRKAFFAPSPTSLKAAPEAQRLVFFDFAKGVAIIAVVLIHAIYLLFEKFPDYPSFWLNSINNLSRFAVGFFFIASGALLSSGLTKKKIIRVFIPYVIACVAIGLSFRLEPKLILGGIFRGDLLPPYYFIPVLFQFYLFFPIIKKFSQNKHFLLVSLFISYFFYLTQSFNYILGVPFLGQYLFLFAFGLYWSEKLKNQESVVDINPWLIIILVYAALQFMLPAHYYNSRYYYAPAMFVAAHWLWVKTGIRSVKTLQTFGRLSLWIYLLHFPIESFLVNLIQFDFSYSVYLYVFLIAALTMVGSGGASLVISKLYLKISFSQ